ncbi:MAG: DUF2490 domain-containing protein, partial [Prolixibacteraceae bacterium]
MIKYIFATILLLGLFLEAEAGQPKETDSGMWLDFAAMKKFHKAAFGVVGEFYTRANNTSIDRTSVGFKGEYAFHSWLNAGAGFTWMNFKRPGYLELRERFYFQLEPALKCSNFTFFFRERFQVTMYKESRTGTPDAYYWRNKIEGCYRKVSWKLEPLISVESLYLIKGYDRNIFDEFRYIAGVNYHFSGNQKIKIYEMFTCGTTLNRYLFGLSYEIRF